VVSANQIYIPDANAVFDLSTGASVWSSSVPGPTIGAAAGTFIVSRDRWRVLAEPR
jgi:hypothetical protein